MKKIFSHTLRSPHSIEVGLLQLRRCRSKHKISASEFELMTTVISFFSPKTTKKLESSLSYLMDNQNTFPLTVRGVIQDPCFKEAIELTVLESPSWFYDYPRPVIAELNNDNGNMWEKEIIQTLQEKFKLRHAIALNVLGSALGFQTGNEYHLFLREQHDILYNQFHFFTQAVSGQYPENLLEEIYNDAASYYATQDNNELDRLDYVHDGWIARFRYSEELNRIVTTMLDSYNPHNSLSSELLSKGLSELTCSNLIRIYFPDQKRSSNATEQYIGLMFKYFLICDLHLIVSRAAIKRIRLAATVKERDNSIELHPLQHDELRYNSAWVKFFGGLQFVTAEQVRTNKDNPALMEFRFFLAINNIHYELTKNVFGGINNPFTSNSPNRSDKFLMKWERMFNDEFVLKKSTLRYVL